MNYSIKIYTHSEPDILERSIEGYIRANTDEYSIVELQYSTLLQSNTITIHSVLIIIK